MLSTIPLDLSNMSGEDLEKQLLRIGLIAELEEINLYERLAALSKDEKIKKTFQKIAKEEKEHVGEFETLLLRTDKDQLQGLGEGTKTVEAMD